MLLAQDKRSIVCMSCLPLLKAKDMDKKSLKVLSFFFPLLKAKKKKRKKSLNYSLLVFLFS
jgi:hypothetical protein